MEYPSPRPPINGEINSFREDLDRGQRAVLIIDETRASNDSIFSLSLSGMAKSSVDACRLAERDSRRNLEAEFRIGVPSRDASLHDGSTTVE